MRATGSAGVLPDWLANDEAASRIGRSGSWLNQQRAQGKGPRYVRMGGRVLYRIADLDDYVKASTVETEDSRRSTAQ